MKQKEGDEMSAPEDYAYLDQQTDILLTENRMQHERLAALETQVAEVMGNYQTLLDDAVEMRAQNQQLRRALSGLLADIEEYQTINNLGGQSNLSQVNARAALAATDKEKP